MRAHVFIAVLVATPLAQAQVTITDANHRLSVFAEADLDPDHSDSFVGSALGHFADQRSIEAGYPSVLSRATAMEDSTILADTSIFEGVLSADAEGWTYEWDRGMGTAVTSLTASFTVVTEIEIVFDYAIETTRQGALVTNYAEVGLLSMSTYNYLYIADHGYGANGFATSQAVTLAPGDYLLNFTAEAFAGTLSEPGIAAYAAETTLTYDVAFVPAPPSLAAPFAFCLLTACRRRHG
ncbi:MAG: hypothetical protein ACF8Q5_07395 [Phycisphaerales bacterium JB040]